MKILTIKSGVEVGTDAGDTEDISTLKISEKGQQLLNNQTFKQNWMKFQRR